MDDQRAAITAGSADLEEEAALLAAYAAGDPSAARLLTRRLGPRAMGQAVRMLADRAEAEDVVQEAFLRLWRAAPGWRTGEARVSTWLYRVVANLAVDRLRRRAALGLDQIPEPMDERADAAAGMLTAARHRALAEALAALPERQAQAVALRHLEGLGNPEIAAIMETGVEAVESLIARGKRALAAALGARREELGWTDD